MILQLENPTTASALQQRLLNARSGLRCALMATSQPALHGRICIRAAGPQMQMPLKMPYQRRSFWQRLAH